MSRASMKADLADQPMWESLAELLGARLVGWSLDYAATMALPEGETLYIGREMRDSLIKLRDKPQ